MSGPGGWFGGGAALDRRRGSGNPDTMHGAHLAGLATRPTAANRTPGVRVSAPYTRTRARIGTPYGVTVARKPSR